MYKAILKKSRFSESTVTEAVKSFRVVRELLRDPKNVVSVNDLDEDQNTPLHLAASKGHFHIVEILLTAGADVELRSYVHCI